MVHVASSYASSCAKASEDKKASEGQVGRTRNYFLSNLALRSSDVNQSEVGSP